MLFLFSAFAFAGEINACKYLVVKDFSDDPYGIAQELSEQAKTKASQSSRQLLIYRRPICSKLV
jgi:hypothetical protein